MKTTLNLDDDILRRAKVTAAQRGETLTGLVEEALRAALAPRVRQKHYRLAWKTRRGRLLPGVDINDRDALYERMEDRS